MAAVVGKPRFPQLPNRFEIEELQKNTKNKNKTTSTTIG